MTNPGWWQRVISLEILGSICLTIFLVGGAWASLGSNVSALSDDVERAESKAEDNAAKLGEVKESIAEVEKAQAVTNTQLEGVSERLDAQGKKLDQIYKLLLER